MGNFITGIHVIRRESHIKAKTIKIRTTGQRHIEETINLVNNGISAMLSSHSRTPEEDIRYSFSQTPTGI